VSEVTFYISQPMQQLVRQWRDLNHQNC